MDGVEERAMQEYLRAGEKRAFALGNRGPIRFTAKGELHPEIVEAYWRCGFYVFEGVLRPDHVPTVTGDSNENAGYSAYGRLFAIGYIRGLREAVYRQKYE